MSPPPSPPHVQHLTAPLGSLLFSPAACGGLLASMQHCWLSMAGALASESRPFVLRPHWTVGALSRRPHHRGGGTQTRPPLGFHCGHHHVHRLAVSLPCPVVIWRSSCAPCVPPHTHLIHVGRRIDSTLLEGPGQRYCGGGDMIGHGCDRHPIACPAPGQVSPAGDFLPPQPVVVGCPTPPFIWLIHLTDQSPRWSQNCQDHRGRRL